MTPSVATTQTEVLETIIGLLQAAIKEFNKPNVCFLTLQIEPQAEVRQNIFCTVCPNSGEFDQSVEGGAGDDGILEMTGVTVTAFSEINLDRKDEEISMLTHEDRGLLRLKQKILKCLAGKMLRNAAGDAILTATIAPVSSGFPAASDSGKHGRVSVSFSTNFEWDLTEDDD